VFHQSRKRSDLDSIARFPREHFKEGRKMYNCGTRLFSLYPEAPIASGSSKDILLALQTKIRQTELFV
jgi:hypothetical protein